jgi:hypothetical protein
MKPLAVSDTVAGELDTARAVAKDAVARLAEHFDAVQVLATRVLPSGDTLLFEIGSGDMYARRGAAMDWVSGAVEAIDDDEDEADAD